MDVRACFGAGLPKVSPKADAVVVIAEDVLARVAPVHEMANSPRVFDSEVNSD